MSAPAMVLTRSQVEVLPPEALLRALHDEERRFEPVVRRIRG